MAEVPDISPRLERHDSLQPIDDSDYLTGRSGDEEMSQTSGSQTSGSAEVEMVVKPENSGAELVATATAIADNPIDMTVQNGIPEVEPRVVSPGPPADTSLLGSEANSACENVVISADEALEILHRAIKLDEHVQTTDSHGRSIPGIQSGSTKTDSIGDGSPIKKQSLSPLRFCSTEHENPITDASHMSEKESSLDHTVTQQGIIESDPSCKDSEVVEESLFMPNSFRPLGELALEQRLLLLKDIPRIQDKASSHKNHKNHKRSRSQSPNGRSHVESRKKRELNKRSKTMAMFKPPKRNRKGKKSGILDEHEEFINYDPIAAQNEDQDFGPAPDIVASKKGEQLKAMLDGCPDGPTPQNRSDKATIDRAQRSFGRNVVSALNGRWFVKGMRTGLMNHQIIGCAWMHGRENNTDEGPFGGILADVMGLGKTIQTIATIVAQPPTLEQLNSSCGTTLIVVPASLLDQWQEEIFKHCTPQTLRSVGVYRASDRASLQALTRNDVVITSYWQATYSVPWNKRVIKGIIDSNNKRDDHEPDKTAEQIATYIDTLLETGQGGDLHQIQWHRVVLDESHIVKNHLSKISFAVNALKGKYRWSLSGTPIMNHPEEYFAHLRFLRAVPVPTFSEFQQKYCQSESLAKLKRHNQNLMFRRTLKSRLLGRPLLCLPKPTEAVISIVPHPAERIVYDAIRHILAALPDNMTPRDPRRKFKHKFNKLTRLRQLTFDVLLIPREIKILCSDQDFETILHAIEKSKSQHHYAYTEFKTLRQEKKDDEETKRRRQAAGVFDNDDEDSDDDEYLPCSICFNPMEDPHIINVKGCKHAFCKLCIDDHVLDNLEDGEDLQCPKCYKPFDPEDHIVKRPRKFAVKETHKRMVRQDQKLTKDSRRGLDFLGHRAEPQSKKSSAWAWLKKHDAKKERLQLSSKMIELRKELYNLEISHPDDKTIVFVQFMQSANLIGTMLAEDGRKFIYYDGTLNHVERKRATSVIETNPEIKIMICGLKCGSLGLNWTWANHVIITDPWWNKCVESQAFSRTHRLGQEKNTFLTKLAVDSTVDDTLLQIQKRKMAMINSTTVNELTSEEMRMLLWERSEGNGLEEDFE